MDFGRHKIIQRIDGLHGRSEPAHLSLVGPMKGGKTMIARAVTARHRTGSDRFKSAALVELRNQAPESGEALLAKVALALHEVAHTCDQPELSRVAHYLLPTPDHEIFPMLKRFCEASGKVGARWLVVLDGLDGALESPDIPRNAWDNLRFLGERGAFCFLTSTRAPLSQLCNKDVRLSPFFNLFEPNPVLVGALDDQDWQYLAEQWKERMDRGAVERLRYWTGGNPYLLDVLAREFRGGRITAAHVDMEAEELFKKRCEAMPAIWYGCSSDTQRDLTLLVNPAGIADAWSRSRVRELTDRGLAREAHGILQSSCELMRRHAAEQQPGVESLRRLFGTDEGFTTNMRGLLRLRFDQSRGIDAELARVVHRSLRDVSEDPTGTLLNARDMADRALELVWSVEAPGGNVPLSWIEGWKYAGLTHEVENYGRIQQIPEERGKQCGLLRLATGKARVKPVAKRISKATCILIEHMSQLGDLKNHSRSVLTTTLAASFCLAAIELCESLARDLAGAPSPTP